jgi:hypothetical protein
MVGVQIPVGKRFASLIGGLEVVLLLEIGVEILQWAIIGVLLWFLLIGATVGVKVQLQHQHHLLGLVFHNNCKNAGFVVDAGPFLMVTVDRVQ